MRARFIFAAATCAGLLACGAGKPSKELQTARDTYNRARVSSAAQYSPTAVLEAKQALDTAEQIHKNDPGSDVERSYSYIATRRAEEAMVLGDISWRFFKDSWAFPIALTFIGIAVIFAGVWWSRNELRLTQRLQAWLPHDLRELLAERRATVS